MAKTNKILVGCGIGCGGLLLLAVISGVGGVMWVRGTMAGFNEAIDVRQQIEARHGPAEAFVPAADGAISPSTMTAFLAVRTATDPARTALRTNFSALPVTEDAARELHDKPFLEKLASVWHIGGSAMRLAGTMGDFFAARNQALLDHDLGMGEYTFVYVLAYYSLLHHSPDDGPDNVRVEGLEDDDEPFSLNIEPSDGSGEGRQDRSRRQGTGALKEQVRRTVLAILRNQLDALDETAENTGWATRLAAEIRKMEDHEVGVPWSTELPPAIGNSLEPYRDQLEATYSPLVNPFELGRNRRRGSFAIQSD
ncbi:MAG: hypothetical protein ACE5IK_03510 [Acidobacteriota bacterium]